MPVEKPLLICLASSFLALVVPSAAAGLVPDSFTNTPVNSWGYSELTNAGHGQSTTYFATTYAEYDTAVFQGFVTYNHGTPHTSFYGDDFDSIQVFSAFLTSQQSETLTIAFGGDDGSSRLVNHQFVGGGGFGATTIYNLSLQAGVATEIDLVGYNGPGNWVFGIGLQDGTLLEDVPGLSLYGNGPFTSVPEPSSFMIAVAGAIASLAYRCSRR